MKRKRCLEHEDTENVASNKLFFHILPETVEMLNEKEMAKLKQSGIYSWEISHNKRKIVLLREKFSKIFEKRFSNAVSTLSRMHGVIEFDNNQVYLVDKSVNGIVIDGVAVGT